MDINHGKGTTPYGPGVETERTGEDVAGKSLVGLGAVEPYRDVLAALLQGKQIEYFNDQFKHSALDYKLLEGVQVEYVEGGAWISITPAAVLSLIVGDTHPDIFTKTQFRVRK